MFAKNSKAYSVYLLFRFVCSLAVSMSTVLSIVYIVIYVVNPGYLKPLLESDIGHMFIIGAIILEVIGFIIIQRIVDIKV